MYIYVDRATDTILSAFSDQPEAGPPSSDLIITDEPVEPGRRWDRQAEAMAPRNTAEQEQQDKVDAWLARRLERQQLRDERAIRRLVGRRPQQIRNQIRAAFSDPDQQQVIEGLALALAAIAGDQLDDD